MSDIEIREALETLRTFVDHTPYRGTTSKAVEAHEAISYLAAALERAERERDNWHASNYAERQARLKAERALAETRQNVEQALDELEAAGSDPAPLRVVRFALRPSEAGR